MEMTVAIVNVSGVVATANRIKLITRGIVGANVQIVYDSTVWIGLRKTVVFEGSGVTRDVLDAREIVEIPPEVASEANSRIRMGIYGVSDDGSVVVPTIWAELGRVRDSADPSGDESTAPELPVWAQLDSRVKKLESQAPSDGDSSDIPVSGGSVDLGVTGATVGQTVKISAVNENGAPTAWEAVDFKTDHTLKLENGTLSVNTTNDMEQDNTLPITSAGVFATVGNIEALLKTI